MEVKYLAGSDLELVVEGMRSLSQRLGVRTFVKFNDISLFVEPDSDVKHVIDFYYDRVVGERRSR